jgi:hypothetical protein
MADFCRTCSEKLGLPAPDIQAEPGQIVYDLCEGCGPGWFDDQGLRVPDQNGDTPTQNL